MPGYWYCGEQSDDKHVLMWIDWLKSNLENWELFLAFVGKKTKG